jgi:hypothetical protein
LVTSTWRADMTGAVAAPDRQVSSVPHNALLRTHVRKRERVVSAFLSR